MRDQTHPTDLMTEETIFPHALAIPPAMRRNFVDRSCDGDPACAAHVMALFDAHEKDGAFLDGQRPDPDLLSGLARARDCTKIS